MKELKVGGFAVSMAGHDFGQYYVIFQIDHEYVYLVDGKIRTLEHTKKKKVKHVKILEQFDAALAESVNNKTIRNEEIKRAIKLLKQTN